MKQIIQISLGDSREDYDFNTEFLNQPFHVKRLGVNGDLKKASDLLLYWNKQADAIGLGHVKFSWTGKTAAQPDKAVAKLLALGAKLHAPVTTGHTLRTVSQEWALRHIQFMLGNNFFNHARVFFFSGITSHCIARVMAEYTDNLMFADLLIDGGIPKFLTSMADLTRYSGILHAPLRRFHTRQIIDLAKPARAFATERLRHAIAQSQVIVAPHYDFYTHLDICQAGELTDKTIISATVTDQQVDYLKDKGVAMIIDTTPKILDQIVGVSVLEALLFAALDIEQNQGSQDDLLEIISDMQMMPRIIYPSGRQRRINRFAYLIHPPTSEALKKIKPVGMISDVVPGMLPVMEKAAAYAPPWIYSTVSGIQSPHDGVAAEGWLIALGATPEQMNRHPPEFTTQKILAAAKLAQTLGAQILGVGMLPKAMKNVGPEIAKHAVLPITTGNSYTASAALWAAAEAVRRMGLIRHRQGKLQARTMVIGATGTVGAICSRLLATAFEEIHLVGRNIAKLLALQESIRAQAPQVKLHVSTRADKNIDHMDVVVTASARSSQMLDVMRFKPGCVVVDINLPMIFSKQQAAKRPDILIVSGGHIQLPGDHIEMADIDLPPGVVYAGLAETIALALEGRYETFTVGSAPQWENVREIYRMGLKHGMKLAAISGVNGIFSDEDIERVKALARKNA